MAQADYIISNQTFPNTRADINSHLQAIATNNSGTSAPTTQYAGQFWIDTTSSTWTLYIHDGSDDIQFATIDTSANTVNFTDSALDVVTDTTPQLGGNLDLNSNDITGTGNINITGTGTFSGDLTVDTNTLKVDSSNNRVGIGTASPVRKFVIYDSSEPYLALQNSTTGTGTADGLLIGIGSVNSFFINRENQDLFFSTNNTEAMRITSSGNVGIGTSSPTDTNGFGKALDIQGSTGGAIYVGSSGDRGIFAYASGEQHIINPSASGTTRFTVNGSERMRIDSSGNVGIGETAPLGKVHIKSGDSGVSSVGGDKDELVIENNTHSGITTLAGDSYESGMFFGHTSDTRAGEIYTHYTNQLMTIGTRMSGGAVKFISDNASERMRIGSDGKVLVNTTSNGTESNLNVQGQFGMSTARGFIFETQEGRNGSGFTSITLQFTTGGNGRTCFIESMVGSSAFYLHHIAHKYSGNTTNVLTNDNNGPTVSWSVSNSGSNTGSVYTYVVNFPYGTSHPYAKFKVSLGGYITTPITSPSITFTQ